MGDEDEILLNNINSEFVDAFMPLLLTFAIVIMLGIVANIFSIVFYGFKEMKREQSNVTFLLLTALSVNNLAACISECSIVYEVSHILTFKSRKGCIAIYFFNHWLVLNSFTLLLLIAVDRYRRICFENSNRQLNISMARKCILGLSTCTFGISCKCFFIINIAHIDLNTDNTTNIHGFHCIYSYQKSLQTIMFISHLIDFILLIMMTVTMTILYKMIVQKIFLTERQMKSHYANGQTIPPRQCCKVTYFAEHILFRICFRKDSDMGVDRNIDKEQSNSSVQTFVDSHISYETQYANVFRIVPEYVEHSKVENTTTHHRSAPYDDITKFHTDINTTPTTAKCYVKSANLKVQTDKTEQMESTKYHDYSNSTTDTTVSTNSQKHSKIAAEKMPSTENHEHAILQAEVSESIECYEYYNTITGQKPSTYNHEHSINTDTHGNSNLTAKKIQTTDTHENHKYMSDKSVFLEVYERGQITDDQYEGNIDHVNISVDVTLSTNSHADGITTEIMEHARVAVEKLDSTDNNDHGIMKTNESESVESHEHGNIAMEKSEYADEKKHDNIIAESHNHAHLKIDKIESTGSHEHRVLTTETIEPTKSQDEAKLKKDKTNLFSESLNDCKLTKTYIKHTESQMHDAITVEKTTSADNQEQCILSTQETDSAASQEQGNITAPKIFTENHEQANIKATRTNATIRRQNAKLAAQKTIVFMMVAMTIAFAVPFIPYFYACFFIKPDMQERSAIFNLQQQFAFRGYILYGAITPYIMGFTNPKFRQFVTNLVRTYVMRNRDI